MKTKVQGKALLRVRNANGDLVSESPWHSNLVFDSGLNRFANGQSTFPGFFSSCKVGSSNAANVITSGAVTFTQAGTVITATGSFFTPAMNGALIKYGTGSAGAEQYITYVSATIATSATSMTVVSGVTGVVYLVQQTSLVAWELNNASYLSTGNSTTLTASTGTVTLQRTFVFTQQGSTYNVNEIGYSSNSNSDGTCNGRIVLSSTVTVSSSQFLEVVVIMVFIVSPATIISVSNVGSGIDTTGQAVYGYFDCGIINSDGSESPYQSTVGSVGGNMMDTCGGGGNPLSVCAVTQAILPLGNLVTGANFVISQTKYILGSSTNISNSGQAIGVGVGNIAFSLTTAGENCYGFVFGRVTTGTTFLWVFPVAFTTPAVLPAGNFAGTITFQNSFSRTLTN